MAAEGAIVSVPGALAASRDGWIKQLVALSLLDFAKLLLFLLAYAVVEGSVVFSFDAFERKAVDAHHLILPSAIPLLGIVAVCIVVAYAFISFILAIFGENALRWTLVPQLAILIVANALLMALDYVYYRNARVIRDGSDIAGNLEPAPT